jgi:hypothetical protein
MTASIMAITSSSSPTLLFLKMTDEKGIELHNISWVNEKHEKMVTDCSWAALRDKSGSAVLYHFTEVLRALSSQQGMLGDIFAQSRNQFNSEPEEDHRPDR